MNEKYTENKGCAGLRSNPAHPFFRMLPGLD